MQWLGHSRALSVPGTHSPAAKNKGNLSALQFLWVGGNMQLGLTYLDNSQMIGIGLK